MPALKTTARATSRWAAGMSRGSVNCSRAEPDNLCDDNQKHGTATSKLCRSTPELPRSRSGRVIPHGEVHLFTYGYFQHAKFIRQNGKDAVEIQFQDRIVMVKGKGLEPLCDALERLAVERIKVRPEKYEGLGKSE